MKRYVVLCSGVLLLVCIVFFVRTTPLGSLLDPAYVKGVVVSYGAFAPLVYMSMYVLACMVFFPGTPLTLIGGVLFGPILGTLYAVMGATIGATCAFYFSRFFGGGIMSNKAGGINKKLIVYNQSIERNGLATVLFLRFVPLFPFNALNFALGFTNIKSRDYILGTFLGIIPGTMVFVFFGDSLGSHSLQKIVFALLALMTLLVIGKYMMGKYGKK